MGELKAESYDAHVLQWAAIQLMAADAAWMAELATTFGDQRIDAMAAVPAGQGEEGSMLRALYVDHDVALAEWRSTRGLI